MEVKKIMIWMLINNEEHPLQTEAETKISATIPIIDTLFPGINYYSISGFAQVKADYVTPVLLKLFPELKGMDPDEIKETEFIELEAVLHSKGYEHLSDPKWKERLNEFLNKKKLIVMPQSLNLKFNVRRDRWYVFKKRVPMSEPETIVEPFQGHQLDEAIAELPEEIGTELFISRIKCIPGMHIPAFHEKNPMIM